MASKQATEQEPEELLDVIDQTLDRLKVLYEQYFLGIQKQPPAYMHSDVERKLRDVTQLQLRNTRMRYRLATVQQKFGAYNSYWRRTLRQIENGTYVRNLSKIGRDAARTGAPIPEEILAAMPKRMRDQVTRDRETALAQAARRTRVSGTQAAVSVVSVVQPAVSVVQPVVSAVQPAVSAVRPAPAVIDVLEAPPMTASVAVAVPTPVAALPSAPAASHAPHVHPRTVPASPASRPPPIPASPASMKTGPIPVASPPRTGPIPVVAASVVAPPPVRRPAPPPIPVGERTGPVRKFPPPPPPPATPPANAQPPAAQRPPPPLPMPPPIPKPKPKP